MDKQQILRETILNPKWFRMTKYVVVSPKDFSQNHHLVYLSDNIKDNCFIKDVSTDDVRDCPVCNRHYRHPQIIVA